MVMEMSGEYLLPTDRKTVWAALNDVNVLQACIPGCEEKLSAILRAQSSHTGNVVELPDGDEDDVNRCCIKEVNGGRDWD